MNKWKGITSLLIILTIVGLGIYDAVAIHFGGTSASISQTLNIWSFKYPAMTFAMGFLMGHLYWRTKPNAELTSLEAKLAEREDELRKALEK
jgi:hypothetical protein